MAIFKNYYQVLGLESFAPPEAIRSAYRKLARQHHPDLNAGDQRAEDRFKEINEAYEILSDGTRRDMHDATLKAMQGLHGNKAAAKNPGERASGSPGKPKPNASEPPADPARAKEAAKGHAEGKAKPQGTPIGDLFESFLKKGPDSPPRQHRPSGEEEGVFRKKQEAPKGGPQEKFQRGEDVVVKTLISPQEALEGVVKTVNVQHNELCRRCSGTGKVNGAVCTGCHGEKILVRLKKIDVRIPVGVKNGSRVRVAKEGGRGAGGAENGDLFLQIEVAYDASLCIEGLDVYGDLPLSVTDMALGAEIDVPTLNGPVKMVVPPGTQPGKVFRLKERGVQSGVARGDHFVAVSVVIPEQLSAREKELYQELARLRPEKPVPKKNR